MRLIRFLIILLVFVGVFSISSVVLAWDTPHDVTSDVIQQPAHLLSDLTLIEDSEPTTTTFALIKQVTPARYLAPGDVLTYTLTVTAPGLEVRLFDPLPRRVDYVSGSLTSTLVPPAVYSPTLHAVVWEGALPITQPVTQTIGFQAMLRPEETLVLTSSLRFANTAWLTDIVSGRSISATAVARVARPAPQELEFVGGNIGIPNASIARGQYVYMFFYAGAGDLLPRFSIVDVRNPAHPRLVGDMLLPQGTSMLCRYYMGKFDVDGSFAYISWSENFNLEAFTGIGGVEIVDISDPTAPHIESSYISQAWDAPLPHMVKAVGDYIYIANLRTVEIVDVSVPAHPALVGFRWVENVRSMEVSGQYLYLGADTGQLSIWNIVNPRNPTTVGTLGWGNWETYVVNMAVSDSYLYAVGYNIVDRDPVRDEGYLQVIDVANPAAPRALEQYTDTLVYETAGIGNGRLYVQYHPWSFNALEENFGGGIKAFDLSTPSAPVELGSYETKNRYLLAVRGHRLLIATDTGMKAVDLTDIANPQEVGNSYSARGVLRAVSGRYGYTGSNEILDLFNPTFWRFVASIGAPDQFSDSKGLVISGNYLYRAGSKGMKVIDISNPLAPQPISYIAWGFSTYDVDMTVSGHYIYAIAKLTDLVNFSTELRVIDVSDPANPILVGSMSASWDTYSFAAVGNYLYVGIYGGIVMIDLSDPTTPTQVGFYSNSNDYPYYVELVVVDPQTLCYSISWKGTVVHILDISDPITPVEIGQYEVDVDTFAENIVARDDRVYVQGLREERVVLQVLDVSNPAIPVDAGSYWMPVAGHLVAENDLLYVGRAIVRFPTPGTGQVQESDGRPFSGVTISVDEIPAAATGLNGKYIVEGLTGTHTLAPALDDYTFWPPTRTVVITEELHAQNFVILAPPVSTTLMEDQAGSLVYTNLRDLTTRLDFPPGVVSHTTRIVLSPRIETDIAGWMFAGHAFDLRAEQDGSPVDVIFRSPVRITLHYSDQDWREAAGEEQLELRYWDGTGWKDAAQTCEPAAASIHNVTQNELVVTICRPGRFALFDAMPLMVNKQVSPAEDVHNGDTLTYTLTLYAPDQYVRLWDPLPGGVQLIADSITGTAAPLAVYSPTLHAILWEGELPTDTVQTVRFQVTAGPTGTGVLPLSAPIVNKAWLTATESGRSVSATAIVNGRHIYLPTVLR